MIAKKSNFDPFRYFGAPVLNWLRAKILRDDQVAAPRFGFHVPLDSEMTTLPPAFDPPIAVDGEPLLLPPLNLRHNAAVDDHLYLDWGRYDHDIIMDHVRRAFSNLENLRVMDFGCSSGRILRHFYHEIRVLHWRLTGVDILARQIEWLRTHFPKEFCVYTGTTFPHLPFESNSFDVIYGNSVFTHIKFSWDMWLLELRRVLKPGGMLIQTVHTEHAWDFFYREGKKSGRATLNGPVFDSPVMPADFVNYGNIDDSNTFYKQATVLEFWGRYFDDIEIFPPPNKYNYQDWVVARKP